MKKRLLLLLSVSNRTHVLAWAKGLGVGALIHAIQPDQTNLRIQIGVSFGNCTLARATFLLVLLTICQMRAQADSERRLQRSR